MIAVILAFAAAETAALPARDNQRANELRFGLLSEPATLDPLSPSNTADGRSLLFNVYEGLVKPDPSGRLIPAAAESYEISSDGKTYSFILRQGLLFHDSSPLLAADVEFTLNEAAKAGFFGFTNIERITITGDRRIEIKLKETDPEFLSNLTIGIVPKNNPDREGNPIGSGPFRIESYNPQQNITLVKNPHYRTAGLPKLDRVTGVFSADYNALYTSLAGGNINGAMVPGDIMEKLVQSNYDVTESYSNSIQLLALNNAVKPFDDVRVRQAVNFAVNKQEIIDTAFYGRGRPTGSPLIPGLALYYNETLRDPYPYNTARARALLAEAGLPDGFSIEIKIPSNYAMHIDTGQVLVNQLARAGIRATIRLVDWATWLSDVYYGRNYEATIISLDSNTISPSGFLSRYVSSSGSNFINFTSQRYDTLYRELLTEINEERRIGLYREAQKIISDEAASVYIQDIFAFTVFSGGFRGTVNYPLYVMDFSVIYRD